MAVCRVGKRDIYVRRTEQWEEQKFQYSEER